MSDSRPAPARLSPLNLLAEMTYPEYRNRHIFTARLRLFVFCGFFLLYVFGLSERYPLTHPALVAIGLGTLATVFCYYNIFTGRWMIPSFVLEVCADMVGISAAVALLGGLESNTYLLYFCYCLGGGLFYNYRVAAALASASLLSYFTLSWLALSGHLGPELMVTTWQFPIQHGMLAHPAWVHPALLTLLLFFAVYSVKMGQNFSQHREQVLEARNRELMALQRIGGMIRTTATLETVADRVVQALVEGLSFAGCLLMLVDRDRNALVCYPPSNLPALTEAESILQVALRDLTLPLGATENPVLQQVLQRKIVFRRNLADLLPGMIPHIPPERIAKLQARLGLQKSVILPLVAEGELLGALVGFTREGFVEERTVATLEAFANQSALVLRVTLLIDQLTTTNRDLLEANRVKSEFLATMSHELRTPLTAIIGFSELVQEGTMGPVTEEQQDSLREILNNGANLLELINNLLDLAKAESGSLKLHLDSFDLRDLLERTQRTLGSLLARKQQTFTLEIPRPLPPIEADARRIQQVLLNLLGNAIKFTDTDGTITIRALAFDRLDSLRGTLWRQHQGDPRPFAQGGILLQVSDTGIGIPASHLRSIFEMFRQVDSSVTRQYEGTGLGLALVRQLVEMHHGSIWAESVEGQGTTFSCLLPIEQPGPESAQPHTPKTPLAIPTIRVPV